MNLPQIDVSSLPDLSNVSGVFGSLADKAMLAADDSTIIIITFLYDILQPK